jgi:hypothetical protein
MSEKQETVEVTIRLPNNIAKALKEFVLKYSEAKTIEVWLEQEIAGWVAADIDFIVDRHKVDSGDPKPTLEKYGLGPYY